jgi:hypothetical protein
MPDTCVVRTTAPLYVLTIAFCSPIAQAAAYMPYALSCRSSGTAANSSKDTTSSATPYLRPSCSALSWTRMPLITAPATKAPINAAKCSIAARFLVAKASASNDVLPVRWVMA